MNVQVHRFDFPEPVTLHNGQVLKVEYNLSEAGLDVARYRVLDGVPGPMPRAEVYAAIDGERDYQDGLGADRTDGHRRTVGDYLTMFQYYLDQAIAAWTTNPGDEQALDVIRKLAGIAVHCMEDHGAPKREG